MGFPPEEVNGEEPLEGELPVIGENVFSGVGIVHAVFCALSDVLDDCDDDDLVTGEGEETGETLGDEEVLWF